MNPPMYELSSFGWNFSRFVCLTLWVSTNHSLNFLTHRSVFLVVFLFLCSIMKYLSSSSIRSYSSGALSTAICGGSTSKSSSLSTCLPNIRFRSSVVTSMTLSSVSTTFGRCFCVDLRRNSVECKNDLPRRP